MPFSRGGGGLDQLTGDVLAGPGTGIQPATLATVTTAGTVGDASHYPVVTTDDKGRVTSMAATAIPTPATNITAFREFISANLVPLGTSIGTFTWITSTTTFEVGTYLVFLVGASRVATGGEGAVIGSGQVANGTGVATSVAVMDISGGASDVTLVSADYDYEHSTVLLVTVTTAGTLSFQWYLQPNGTAYPQVNAGSGFIALKIA